jgi:hypothetical protein
VSRQGHTLSRLAPAALLLLAISACSGTNLGDIDEEVNSREQMPGPGVLADEEGESALKWSSASKESEAAASTTTSAAVTTSAATSDAVVQTPEQEEFEQFKAWNELKSGGADSAEYQEFLQWLEYQKFKSSQ